MKFFKKQPFLLLVTLIVTIIGTFENLIVAEAFRRLFEIAENGALDQLMYVFLSLTIIYSVINGLEILASRLQNKVIRQVNRDMRSKLFSTIMTDFSIGENGSGESLSKLTNDYKYFEDNYLKQFFSVIQLSSYFFFSLGYALYLDWQLAILFVFFSLISSRVPRLFQNKIVQSSNQWTEESGKYTELLREMFMGKRTIVSYGVEEQAIAKVRKKIEFLEKSNESLGNSLMLSNGIVGFAGTLCFLIPLFIGVFRVVDGTLSIGLLLALNQVSNTIAGPFLRLLTVRNTILSAQPIAEQYLKMIVKKNDSENEQVITMDIEEISYRNVTVCSDSMLPLLTDLNFEIHDKEKVLILGKSGSGKSTLLNSLVMANSISKGVVELNGRNIQTINQQTLFQNYSFIQQNVFLLNDSIRENITLGKNEFTDEDILEALSQAGLKDFIQQRGLDFIIGENGEKLSGGEKKRMEVARAFLNNRNVLLIDEATSDLDKETSNVLRSVFLNTDKMVLEIAHQIDKEQLDSYDKAIVLDSGHIVEYGLVEDLMKDENSYLYCI